MDLQPFTPAGDSITLAVTTSSARTALTAKPSGFPETTVIVTNGGSVTAFVAFGSSTVAAVVATSVPIPAGTSMVFSVSSLLTHIAAITSTGSTTLYATSGTGVPYGFGGGGASAGSSAVTIADGADVTLGAIADAAATAGGTGTVSAKLRRLSAQLPAALGQTTGSSSISMVPASDAAIMGFAYGGTKVAVTRANNTTPYGANAVVGGAFEFTNMGPSGGRIAIMRYQFEYDVTALPSGATSFFLALYSVTPPSAYADGATWDLPSGDRASFLGLIPLGTPVDLGSTLYIEGQPLQSTAPAQYKLAGTSLFAYCVTTTGYTPAAQTVQQFTLHSVGLGL